MHFGVFKERIFSKKLLETLDRHEMVIYAVLLLAARLTRGAGDGILEIAVFLKKQIYERGLSAARRCAHHDEKWFCLLFHCLIHSPKREIRRAPSRPNGMSPALRM